MQKRKREVGACQRTIVVSRQSEDQKEICGVKEEEERKMEGGEEEGEARRDKKNKSVEQLRFSGCLLEKEKEE